MFLREENYLRDVGGTRREGEAGWFLGGLLGRPIEGLLFPIVFG
jgi:hypothetical protein